MSMCFRLTMLLLLAWSAAYPIAALDVQSTTTPDRMLRVQGLGTSLTEGEIATIRADKNLIYKKVDGTLDLGALLDALPSSRKAMKLGDASDLAVRAGPRARSLADRFRETLSVVDYGVECDNTTDDGPALRTLFRSISGKRVRFPAGQTCYLGSFVDPGYPGNRAAMLVMGQADFQVEATNTTFRVGPDPAPVSAIQMDRSKRWTWNGGRFVGDRSLLGKFAENAAFAITSNVNWKVSNAYFTGLGGKGAGFVGGWNVNGRVEDVVMEEVGLGFDIAWAKNLIVNHVIAKGADTFGRSGAGQVGDKFFSNVEDRLISANFNYTGVDFNDTDSVTITNSDISNFVTPIYLASGRNWQIKNNIIHENPVLDTARGIPIFIDYITNATYSSAGHPVSNVTLEGNVFRNNGVAVPGFAVLIAAAGITNGDVIDGVTVDNNIFDNNADTAIYADSLTNIRNLSIGTGNTYRGATQTTRMNNIAQALAGPFQVDANGDMTPRSATGGAARVREIRLGKRPSWLVPGPTTF